jgi:hypothetical protein
MALDIIYFVTQSDFRWCFKACGMKISWFKAVGWFYLPVSIPGGLIWLAAAAFCATVFRAVDRHAHSVSDTLYGVFPFFVCTFLLLDWIGRRTSDQTH